MNLGTLLPLSLLGSALAWLAWHQRQQRRQPMAAG
jgi:hypothetical protein